MILFYSNHIDDVIQVAYHDIKIILSAIFVSCYSLYLLYLNTKFVVFKHKICCIKTQNIHQLIYCLLHRIGVLSLANDDIMI